MLPVSGAWSQTTASSDHQAWLESLPPLHHVELASPEAVRSVGLLAYPRDWSRRAYRDLTPEAAPQALYYVTFAEGETFRFIFPVSYSWAFQEPVFALGGTEFRYAETVDGRRVAFSINIPNKILRIRAALLAAERYFNAAAETAGVDFRLHFPELPIDIYIGRFAASRAATSAYATFWLQEIRFRDDIPESRIESTTVHELFHIAQGAIYFVGEIARLTEWRTASHELVAEWLSDATAEWASDEPIQIPAAGGRQAQLDLDSVNAYYAGCRFTANNPFKDVFQDLFARNRYCSGMVIKFYAEQLAQGSDTANPEAVLDLLKFIGDGYRPITADSLVEALAESLPAERYPGANWRERWRHFYTDYAVTALIQNATVAAAAAGGRYGIHDDALANQLFADYPDQVPEYQDDYLQLPDRLFATPATSERERARRLASVAQPAGTMLSYAHPYLVLDVEHGAHGEAPPRSVFVYARGEEGTNAYALRQSLSRYRGHRYRSEGQFTRIAGFSLLGAARDEPGIDVAELQNIDTENAAEFVWLGFVNVGPGDGFRDVEWSYLAAPRILRVFDRTAGYRSVRLTGGTAAQRRNPDEWYDGDSFEFEVATTGQLHLGEGDRTNIPADERTIDLSLQCGDGQAVMLTEDHGQAVQVASRMTPGSEVRPSHFTYRISGRVDRDNTVSGPCRARVEITSLLNLGGGDRQVDESFAFRLGDPQPRVDRVQISSGGAVVYDSETGEIAPATARDGAYELALKVWFSTLMDWDTTRISAGLRPPYADHEIDAAPEASNAARWSVWTAPGSAGLPRSFLETRVRIPQGALPNGGILGLSISGIAETGVALDVAPEQGGAQPDTHHFALLDIPSFYLATLSMETALTGRRRYAGGNIRRSIDYAETYRPFTAEIRLPELPVQRARFENLTRQWGTYAQRVSAGITQSEQAIAQTNDFLARLDTAVAAASDEAAAQYNAQRQQLLGSLTQQEEALAAFRAAAVVLRRNEPHFRRLMRLLGGHRTYGCSGENPAVLLRARFGGMINAYNSVETGPGGPKVQDTQVMAEGWEAADPAALAWSTEWLERPSSCVRLDVWRFEPDDYRAVADLVRSPPDFALPEGLVSADNILASGAVTDLENLGIIFADALMHVALEAWKFAHQAPGSVRFGRPTEMPVFPSGRPLLPNLPEGPLVRAVYRPAEAWPFPVHATGRHTESFSGDVETAEFEFTNRDADDSGVLSSLRYTTNVFGGTVPRRPQFSPRSEAYDIVWDVETGTPGQVTNRTFRGHIHEGSPDLVIAGPAPGGILSGGLIGRWRFSHPEGDQNHETRVRWHFEPNGLVGDGAPREEGIDVAADDAGPPPDTSPLDVAPDDAGPPPDTSPLDVAPDVAAADEAHALAPDDSADRADAAPLEDAREDGSNGTLASGSEADVNGSLGEDAAVADDGTGGLIVPPTIVRPTIRYSGVVTGAVINTSAEHDPGHALLYLEGEHLPPRDQEPVLMDLKDGFRQSFMALPVNGAIRFRNVEEAGGVHYEIHSEDEVAAFQIALAPGEEEVVAFPREGRATILNKRDPAHRLTLHVIPSTRFNAMMYEGQGYIIRDIPPASYVLRVVTENRRYQPLSYEVTIRDAGNTLLDVELFERGSVAAGLHTE